MAMQTGNGGSNLPMSEINVTPLVDVMLVLLIIFMVAAPHLTQGVNVDLPEASVSPLPAVNDQLVIKIAEDKKVYLEANGGNMEFQDLHKLELAIKDWLPRLSGKEVYIRADKKVPYGFVVQVMAVAQNAGAGGLGMVTQPEEIKIK